jgi:hypothetical protein
VGGQRRVDKNPVARQREVIMEGPRVGEHLVGLLEGTHDPRVSHVNHAHALETEEALIGLGGAEPALESASNCTKFAHKGEREHLLGVLETTACLTEAGPERRSNPNAIEMVTDVARREREATANKAFEPKAAGEAGDARGGTHGLSTACAHG